MENFDPKPGQLWKHYKGGIYKIIMMAKDAEGEDFIDMIIYQKPSEETVFVQSLGRFKEMVNWNGTMIPRYQFVSDN